MSELDGDGGPAIENSASSGDATPASTQESGEGTPAMPADQPMAANEYVPQQGTENSGRSGAEQSAAAVEPGEGTPPVESGSSANDMSSESANDKAIREASESFSRQGVTASDQSFYNGQLVSPSDGGGKPSGGGHGIERTLPRR
jgi:hypothetical protein